MFMNKLDYNVTQLLNELQTFEAILKTRTQKAEANVAETKVSSSSNNKKKRKNNKSASARRPKKKQAAPKASDKKKGSKEKKNSFFFLFFWFTTSQQISYNSNRYRSDLHLLILICVCMGSCENKIFWKNLKPNSTVF